MQRKAMSYRKSVLLKIENRMGTKIDADADAGMSMGINRGERIMHEFS